MIEPERIEENQSRMETARSDYDAAWGEIARLAYPEMSHYFGGSWRHGTAMKRGALPLGGEHEPYTAQALEDGVSVFEGHVMPRGERWQALELPDEALMKKAHVQQGMDVLSRRLFALRNDPESGFVAATHTSAMSLMSFGPQSMWIDDRWDDFGRWAGIAYESEPVFDVWFERDGSGRVLRVHRLHVMTAEAALRKWGADCPPLVKKAVADDKNPQAEFRFLHVIEPNRRFDGERIDMAGMPWHGAFYSIADKAVFRQGGYRSLPRVVSAWSNAAGRIWSPMMRVLPLVRKLVEIERDRAWAAEMSLRAPLLTTDDALDNGVLEIKPDGVTVGGLSDRGDPLVKEFLTQADGTDAEKLVLEARAMIDRAFFRDLLQINREYKSHIPAARIEEERAEKGLLLAPLARQEQEWLAPMTMRELSLMAERGMMDDMPAEVLEWLGENGTVSIQYDNGLSAMQEASGAAAFLSVAGQVGALAQFDPSAVQKFEREYPMARVIPELGRIARIPAAMRSTDEERAAFDEAEAAKAQMQTLLDAAPVLGAAAKDAAMAGSVQ